MLHKINFILLFFFALTQEVLAGGPPAASASVDSWIILAILGLGLPLAAFFFDKKNKK